MRFAQVKKVTRVTSGFLFQQKQTKVTEVFRILGGTESLFRSPARENIRSYLLFKIFGRKPEET
ncbi:MAG: hypothetical protein DMF11_09020 [Verrucomicrobia bacterium]|nr:MAG: hypothetical protein DMF11_09020 [Verrucomicrobiota bacterium]